MKGNELVAIICAIVVALAAVVSAVYVLTSDDDSRDLTPDDNGVITIDDGKSISMSEINKIKEIAANDNNVTLKIETNGAEILFSNDAISTLNSGAKLSVDTVSQTSLSDTEKAIIGDRPVYDITFGNNTDFGTSYVTVSLPYALADGEDPANILIYYMDNEAIVETFEAQYDDGKVTFATSHFSNYVIGDVEGYNNYLANFGYNYYIYLGEDNAKNGWYTGFGNDAGIAFKDAMTAANLDYTINDSGYIGSIDGLTSSWMTYAYQYVSTDSVAAKASVEYVQNDTWDGFAKSNGWVSIAGYNADGVDFKLSEINAKIFLIGAYDYGAGDEPTPVATYDNWSTSGIFETPKIVPTTEKEYNFYIYFGKVDSRNGWYSGKGIDTGAAFDDAMKTAGFEYKASGYITNIDGLTSSWMTYAYQYVSTDSIAFAASVGFPVTNGFFAKSNGWVSIAGYDGSDYENKLSQINYNTYIIAAYDYYSGDKEPSPIYLEKYWNLDKADTYSYYLYLGANDSKNGWYSGNGTDAASGFDNAMKVANITYTISDSGYLSEVNGIKSSWMTYAYQYVSTDSVAAKASVEYVQNDTWEGFAKSNGWVSIAGYDADGVDFKLSELDYNIFLICSYNYGVDDEPTPVATYDNWSTSGIFKDPTTPAEIEQDYYFFLYFGEDEELNYWYKGTGINAAEAFKNMIDLLGVDYTLSDYGYIGSINDVSGFWMTYAYQYVSVDDNAVEASIKYSVMDEYGGFVKSNGWVSIAGYDADGVDFKLSEIDSHYYILAIYDAEKEPSPEAIYSEWADYIAYADY